MTIPRPLPQGWGGGAGMLPTFMFSGYEKSWGLLCRSPHSVMFENKLYPTAFHLWEARKFLDHRPDLADRIRQCEDIDEVLDICLELAEFMRPDWNDIESSTVKIIFTLRICWLIVADGYFDGRGVVPQIPAAQLPEYVTS